MIVDYLLIETANPNLFKLYKSLNLLNINHSFFVFHHLEYLISIPSYCILKKTQIWTLGNFTNYTQVNPHYFGKIILRNKNNITRFFITSTVKRNYKYLISAVEKLKEENLEFNVVVVGKWTTFTYHNISSKVIDKFKFKYNISYSELYNEVNNSDYIIINLDQNSKKDVAFKKTRISGSVQLTYGFLKPAIINKGFGNIYNLNSENSFVYDDNNIIESMRDAIKLGNEHYKKMQNNLMISSKRVYDYSLLNVKNSLNII